MAKVIYKFKKFATTEMLEEWQIDNNVSIMSVTPVPVDIGGRINDAKVKRTDVDLAINMGVFVIYNDIVE